jgi:hypothetical protein
VPPAKYKKAAVLLYTASCLHASGRLSVAISHALFSMPKIIFLPHHLMNDNIKKCHDKLKNKTVNNLVFFDAYKREKNMFKHLFNLKR